MGAALLAGLWISSSHPTRWSSRASSLSPAASPAISPTLYVLPIAAASSLQFRRGGMMIATLSALLYSGIVLTQYFELAGLLGFPFLDHGGALPPPRIVAYTTGLNVFLFFSIAFLSGSLADRLQRAGARLERASSEIADLQAFNQHVIDSLTSGLATTDRQGRILTFNRAAETITGHTALSVVGRRIEEVLELPANVASELSNAAAAGPGPPDRDVCTGRATDGRSSWDSRPRSSRRRADTVDCCSHFRMSPIQEARTRCEASAAAGCGWRNGRRHRA